MNIWIISEWQNDDADRRVVGYWLPVDYHLSRSDGRHFKRDWQNEFPENKYRLTLYQPVADD